MSQQAKARSRQMRNGYAHLGGALKRPRIGIKKRSVAESIAAARRAAMAEAGRRKKA